MELAENSSLAQRMLEDLGNEIWLDKPLPHVTELIYCLTKSWYNRFRPLPYTPRETMLFVVGVGLEKVLLKSHRQHVNCCEEQEGTCPGCDGVHYDLDFLDYDGNVGELKSTRISMDKFLERLPVTWIKQVLSYMRIMQKTAVTLGVVHLMGSYKPPFPEFMAWSGHATVEEIDGNWAWILERRDRYMHYVEIQEAPPQFTFNEDWECGYCAYKIICDANKAIEEARQ